MRPDSPAWIAAKSSGDAAELAIAAFFRDRGWMTFKSLGEADYDLKLECSVEVKHDRMARDTGNVAIEVSYGGQPSGVMTSTAAWWCIVAGDDALLVKLEGLRRFVLAGRFCEVAAGDYHRARVLLVPLQSLRGLEGVHSVPLTVAAVEA